MSIEEASLLWVSAKRHVNQIPDAIMFSPTEIDWLDHLMDQIEELIIQVQASNAATDY